MRVARRSALALLGSSALVGLVRPARASGKFVTIGITLPLTGASAEDATNILHGAVSWRSRKPMPRAASAATKYAC